MGLQTAPEEVGDGRNARVVLFLDARGEDNEFLLRTRERHVERIQIVDIRMEFFLKIICGKDGFRQARAVADGDEVEAVERRRPGVAPQDDRLRRPMINLPIAKRQDYGAETQAFRLVDGQDTDGVLCIGGGDGTSRARVVPPTEKTGQVRAFPLGKLRRHVQKSLDEDLFVLSDIIVEKAVDSFAHFVDREASEAAQGRFLLRCEILPVPVADEQTVGEKGHLARRRFVGILQMPKQMDEKPDDGGAADEQSLVGDDIVAKAALAVRFFVGQEGFGYSCALFVGSHEDGDVFQGVAVCL